MRREGKERIAAILVNLYLPDSLGLETFERLFQTAPDIPILVLSSLGHENTAKLAVQRGAQDYILENHLDGYFLPKALRNMLERASNAEALFREKERAQVTLNSIGDAVVCTDVPGNVTFICRSSPRAWRHATGFWLCKLKIVPKDRATTFRRRSPPMNSPSYSVPTCLQLWMRKATTGSAVVVRRDCDTMLLAPAIHCIRQRALFGQPSTLWARIEVE